ncbi:uncharacterized protein LOC129565011 [Sitodiplosis mosellana]|uniref:uncharacterized protein LOC129565011 n=1 Tax=Sitodiplosis mosellana TaxID=263140 RepID=UPI0024439DFC|nr:uncharacterized protein LOC129565011 [Sitodiplosis mosellana]
MYEKHDSDDDNRYVCSQIKPSWKQAYENGNFGDDFPPDLQVNAAPSQALDQSAVFLTRILNRVRSKQNDRQPVESTAQIVSTVKILTTSAQKPQDILMNDTPCQPNPIQRPVDPRLQIGRACAQTASRVGMLPNVSHQNVHYQSVYYPNVAILSTLNTQRPSDPRLRREWQPVSTQSVHFASPIQPSDAEAIARRRITMNDYKRYTSDPSEPEKDRAISINQVSSTQAYVHDEQKSNVGNDEQIDRSNPQNVCQGNEQVPVASPNDQETEPSQSSSSNIATSIILQPEIDPSTDSSPTNPNQEIEDEFMENVADEEITIKDEVVNDVPAAQNVVEDYYDSYDSDATEVLDFDAFQRERMSHMWKEPVIIDIGEENMSPQYKVEMGLELQEVQKEERQSESEADDSNNQSKALPIRFDFSREVRIVLEDIAKIPIESTVFDFLQKKKRLTKPLPESEAEQLPPIEISSSDDDFVYELSDSDSDIEMIS